MAGCLSWSGLVEGKAGRGDVAKCSFDAYLKGGKELGKSERGVLAYERGD